MFVKCLSVVTCIACFLYIFYVLCSLSYFLSVQNEHKKAIISSQKDESIESVLWSLIVNMSLLSIFMIQHSFMATDFIKHIFCKLHIDYIERSIYNALSAVTLHLLFSQWHTVSSIALWDIKTSSNNHLWMIFSALHILAWAFIYSGCLMMDISELTGLKQVYYKFSFRPSPIIMKSEELLRYYSHMRHPSLTGFLIILWIYPHMTLDRLLLASTFSVYMTLMWTIDKEDYDYHANIVKRKQREMF